MRDIFAPLLRKSSAGFVQLIRYGLLSGVALLVDVGLLYVLHSYFGMHYRPAATLSFFAGMVVVYYGSIGWVFDSRTLRSVSKEFTIFITIGVLGLLLNVALITFGVEKLSLPVMYAKAVSVIFVFSFNFIARKFLLFR